MRIFWDTNLFIYFWEDSLGSPASDETLVARQEARNAK